MLRLFAGLTSLVYVPRPRSLSIACTWPVRNVLPCMGNIIGYHQHLLIISTLADVAACRTILNPAWCRIFMCPPSQSWDIVPMLCPWARHFTLKCFIWLRWKWVPGRTEMKMCTISLMRRNGCRTVCSPWSWNGTRMNRSSVQVGGGM